MEGVYPIIIDGELMGKLTVTQRGPLTGFFAECKSLPGIVRISVYGGGREGCLGVLAPNGEKFTLQKSLSRNAMRDFPDCIDSVERSGLLEEHCRAIAEEGAAAEETIPAETEEEPVPAGAEPVEEAEEDHPIPDPMAEAVPEIPTCTRDDDLYWYSSPDGALVRFDGEQNLVALPLGDPRIPEDGGGQYRLVEGREYMVFRTKNGRLIR